MKITESQTAAIVGRLLKGPAYNYELSRISLKYTSRISDARAQGYNIRCDRITKGTFQYTLEW